MSSSLRVLAARPGALPDNTLAEGHATVEGQCHHSKVHIIDFVCRTVEYKYQASFILRSISRPQVNPLEQSKNGYLHLHPVHLA